MPNRRKQPAFSNDAEIIILNEKDGVKDTTRRPLTGERLKRAQEYVAKMEESRRLAEEYARKNGLIGKPQEDDSVSEIK